MLKVLLCQLLACASPPTLVDHPIESGIAPLYLDGAWSATSSVVPSTPALRAMVPGDILSDLQRNGRTPDPYFNSTWRDPSFVAAWNDGLWTYRKIFATPTVAVGSAALLVFDGIRMGAMITLNGPRILT